MTNSGAERPDEVVVDIMPEAHDAASEDSPLLPTDLPKDIVPSKKTRRLILFIGTIFLFLVEFSQVILEPAIQEIMEDIICRDQYPDHLLRDPHGPRILDDRCKSVSVQKELAMVRSWATSFDLLVPVVVQVSYGMVADKYGRRIVLILSSFGIVLATTWTMVVLALPNVFSVWALLYGSMAMLIGGGSTMLVAMLYTILADVFPASERTNIFLQVTAYLLILAAILQPIGALLLSIDPWLSMWLGFGLLVFGLLMTAFVPETGDLRKEADRRRRAEHEAAGQGSTGDNGMYKPREQSVLAKIVSGVRNDVGHLWRFIFASKVVVFLLIGYAFFFPVRFSFARNILQYMTKRFNWDWSTAAYAATAGNITSAVVLIAVIPLTSMMLTKRAGYTVPQRDLLLCRASAFIAAVGSLLAAFAATPPLFILSLVIFSFGFGFAGLCRALLNAVVEPHTIATLNTTLATIETLVGFSCSPALGWLLGKGMELGGVWDGLMYLVVCASAVVTLGFVLAFRLPSTAGIH